LSSTQAPSPAALYERAGGLSTPANNLAANLAALPLTIVAADKDLSEAAATFKYDFKVPFVDALQDPWHYTRMRRW
jgi:hypothetical protein